MSVVPAEIHACGVAIALLAGPEAHARATIGRAYYSAYHDSKGWHAALSAPGRISRQGNIGVHATLIDQLKHPDVSLGKDLSMKSRSRAYILDVLRVARGRADYDLGADVLTVEANQALADSARVAAVI